MGAGSSVLSAEIAKPLDASDLKSADDARHEVVRLRRLLHENHKNIAATVSMPHGLKLDVPPRPLAPTALKSPTRIDFSRFDIAGDVAHFKLDQCPQLRDYIANEYSRFAGEDQVLQWDEFWRFMKEININLSDADIGVLRQQADTNMDGVVEWEELIRVLEPQLAKLWRAQLEVAPEWDRWVEFHWETHHTVSKTSEGFTKKGAPFWVNKVTGESSWEKPEVLIRHASLEKMRQERALSAPPTIEDFLSALISKGASGKSFTAAEFWKVMQKDINLLKLMSAADVQKLASDADINGDGIIDLKEFVKSVSPKLKNLFKDRPSETAWVALSDAQPDGTEYLYWFNRITGESSWQNPHSNSHGSTAHRS